MGSGLPTPLRWGHRNGDRDGAVAVDDTVRRAPRDEQQHALVRVRVRVRVRVSVRDRVRVRVRARVGVGDRVRVVKYAAHLYR